eukprot:comp22838_c0_seq1/m.35953 comp22838_c0_seq1/g.35953  ORF comp22838_c0_seq1/g.35953 comp22838_c0_seq1/m.35953 type:complete len:272 (-) comp22838_c0_seq1:356-1171(-)
MPTTTPTTTMGTLRGKTALVTGSTSGIGLAVAQALAGEGCNLVLNGFGDWEGAKKVVCAARINPESGVEYHGANMAKAEEIQEMMEFASETFGGVDILVNNAGIQHVAPVEEFAVERWDSVIAINLSSVFHTTRLAIPHMKQANWGRIINIASVHGLIGSVGKTAYVAAKHGVVGMTKVVGLETAGTGVTCNAICPGWVLTPLVQAQVDALAQRENIDVDQAREKLLGEKQPSKEFVKENQLAAMVLFLCSEAAGQVRGAAWTMDGGWTAQ